MAKRKQGYQQAYYNHEAEWILEIPINRERVSLEYRRENADLSQKRLLEAFKRKPGGIAHPNWVDQPFQTPKS